MFSATRWLSLIVGAALAVPQARAADLNKYLPDDTEIVIGLNVTTLIESPLVQKQVPALVQKYGPDLVELGLMLSGQKLDENVVKAIKEGLGDADVIRKFLNDNKNHCNRLLLAAPSDAIDAKMLMVVEGDFNKDKIAAGFDELVKNKIFGLTAKKVKEGKHEFYSFKVADEDEMFIGLADAKNLLLSPNKEELAKALSRSGRAKTNVRKELLEVMSKIDPKATLWAVHVPKKVEEYVNAHGSLIVTDGVKLLLTVNAKDADVARDLAGEMKDAINSSVEGLADFAKELKALGAILAVVKKVEPKVEKNAVTLEVVLPGTTLDKIIKDLPAIK